MRKIIPIIVCSMLLVCMASCNPKKTAMRNQLKRTVAEDNRRCPIENEMGTMTSTSFENNVVTYNFRVRPDRTELYREILTSSYYREAMLSCAAAVFDRECLEQAEALGLTMRYVYSFEDGSPDVVVSYSAEELLSTVSANRWGANDNVETMLYAMAKTFNDICPIPMDEYGGASATGAVVVGKTLRYKYEMDEDIYDLDYLEAILSELKAEQIEQTKQNMLYDIRRIFSRNGITFEYVYVGKQSGKKLSFTLNPDEYI